MSFEKALRKLEEIAQQMSDEAVELEAMLDLYKEGMLYLKHCRNKLEEAEARLELINKNAAIEQELDADGL